MSTLNHLEGVTENSRWCWETSVIGMKITTLVYITNWLYSFLTIFHLAEWFTLQVHPKCLTCSYFLLRWHFGSSTLWCVNELSLMWNRENALGCLCLTPGSNLWHGTSARRWSVSDVLMSKRHLTSVLRPALCCRPPGIISLSRLSTSWRLSRLSTVDKVHDPHKKRACLLAGGGIHTVNALACTR